MTSTNLNRRAFLRGRSSKFDLGAIRPPWSIEISQFAERCTRCDECIKACPENILFRGDGGYPEVNFQHGECTFCSHCADACQAKAFKVKHTDPKDAWQLNVSIKDSCLSLNAVVCRACGDSCPEGAIRFSLQVGGISSPEIDSETCTGCGECLYVCPKNAVLVQNSN